MKKSWSPCDSDSPSEDYVIRTIPDGQRHPLRHTNPDVVYSVLLHDRRIGASYGLHKIFCFISKVIKFNKA